jgi:hypothetical protein
VAAPSSAISELMKPAKSVRRCVPATRAGPSGRSPADRQLTTHRHGGRRTACSPIAARSQTPPPTGHCKRFAEIRLCCAWHRAPAVVGRCCYNHPHVPPSAARERALLLRADAWPPRPRAAQPNLNPPDTTPIPTEYKGVEKAAFGYAQNVLTLSRFRRTSSNGGELAPVGDTGSRARRGRR